MLADDVDGIGLSVDAYEIRDGSELQPARMRGCRCPRRHEDRECENDCKSNI